MPAQLPLDLAQEEPRRRREGALRAAHLQGQPMPVDEALALERRASQQDQRVLAIFRALPGKRLTPSEVQEYLNAEGRPAPMLTSTRRSLCNLTARRFLVHFKTERRDGPRGARESTWGLA